MHQSSFAQYFTQHGKKKSTIEDILDVLEIRFQHSNLQILKPELESIEELQELKQLHREAVQVPSLDEFRRILAS